MQLDPRSRILACRSRPCPVRSHGRAFEVSTSYSCDSSSKPSHRLSLSLPVPHATIFHSHSVHPRKLYIIQNFEKKIVLAYCADMTRICFINNRTPHSLARSEPCPFLRFLAHASSPSPSSGLLRKPRPPPTSQRVSQSRQAGPGKLIDLLNRVATSKNLASDSGVKYP